MYYILAINPGSTSTKIAIFKNDEEVFEKTLRHQTEELEQFEKITDQYEFRKQIIIKEVKASGIDINKINAVVGRGGLVKFIPSGVYEINEAMKADLNACLMGEHASNLGGLIADDIAKSLPNAKSFIADPVVVDEMDDIARFTGHPEFQRLSIFHALNQKAIARIHAKKLGKNYEDINLIVAHLGGGISVGAHYKGKVIDVNNALDGEGPFSPERSGTLPAGAVAKLCFSGKYTHAEIKKMIKGNGGMTAYIGSNDAYKVEMAALDGDAKSKEIFEAMAYQVAKEIGGLSAVLKGDVDAILVTGGIAYSKWFCEMIDERVKHIAPVIAYPGEDEMKALAMNGMRVIKGETEVKVYS